MTFHDRMNPEYLCEGESMRLQCTLKCMRLESSGINLYYEDNMFTAAPGTYSDVYKVGNPLV